MLAALPPTPRGRLVAQLGRGQVDRAVREGELVVVRRGVVAGRSRAPDTAFRVLTQQARIRGPSLASHGTAAELHSLDRLGRASGAIRLLKPSGGAWRDAEVSVGVAQLPAHHVTEVAGVPVTSMARTVVDLGRRATLMSAVVLTDSALRRGCKPADLERVLADCRDWPGSPKAAAAVAFANPLAESVLESVSRVAFARKGLPEPELQVNLGDADGFIGRVDFLWRDRRVVGESDGMAKYKDIVDLHAEKLRWAGAGPSRAVRFGWLKTGTTRGASDPGSAQASTTVRRLVCASRSRRAGQEIALRGRILRGGRAGQIRYGTSTSLVSQALTHGATRTSRRHV